MSDGLRATVTVRTGGREDRVRTLKVQFPSAAPLDADSLTLLAARILLVSDVSLDSIENLYAVSSRSTTSVREYAHGWRALLAGQLDSSAAAFAKASRSGGLAQAVLWRAIVLSWKNGKSEAAWRAAANAAYDRARELAKPDSLLAVGLWLRSSGNVLAACNTFAEATTIRGGTFASWYGLATCLQRDSMVVSDRSSPTGARFRSSYWMGSHAYEEAIDRLLSPHLVPLFSDVAATTLGLNGRQGWGAVDGKSPESFAGLPTLIGDSVTVFPRATRRLVSGSRNNVPVSYARAVAKGRERLVVLARALSVRAPASVAARIAYAHALEYAGYLHSGMPGETALSVLQGAARLARQRRDSIEIGTAEIRIRLRLADFLGAGRAAAAILAAPISRVTSEEAEQLAAIAVLSGRSARAESLLVVAHTGSPENPQGLPLAIANVAAAYTIAAAVGECATLPRRRGALLEYLREHYSPAELAPVQERWVSPGDWMGLTCVGAPIPIGASVDEPLIGAFIAFSAGNRSRAIMAVRRMQMGREGAAASAVSWDTRYAEMWLLLSAGDSVGVRSRLTAARGDLGAMMDYVLVDVVRAAGFRRSLELCEKIETPMTKELSEISWCGKALQSLSTGRA